MKMTEQRSGTFFVKGEKIVLKRDGTWFADGVEITHEQTRDLFYRAIHWDETQRAYCLKVGYETIFIEVEDTPYFVTALEPAQAPRVNLTDGRNLALEAARLSYEKGVLYLSLDGGQRAKFLSAPYYELLKGLEEDARYYYLIIAGKRVDLSPRESESPLKRSGK
jgi:hypothetical protein